jgi:ABC-2 type transport system permease protein
MFAILKRELKTYFKTPTGYIFMALFLLLSGIFFANQVLLPKTPRFAPFLGNILFIFLLVVPILTMRLMTDEKRMSTDQLLLTSPLRISDIVLGKFFAAAVLLGITLLITVFYPVIIAIHGSLDTWETVGSYIGFLLLGCSFISVGVFISTTTESQVSAGIITFGALLIVWIMDFLRGNVPSDKIAGIIFAAVLVLALAVWLYFSTRHLLLSIAVGIVGAGIILLFVLLNDQLFVGFISNVLGWLSPVQRYQDFTMGILKLNAIVYYISFSTFFLFLSIRLIDKKRWV